MLLAGCCAVHAGDDAEPGPDALDSWFTAADVNEGELVFLARHPQQRVLRTDNRITISADSLQTGWVSLDQCQSDLDPVDSIQVLYRYRGLRGLRVVSTRHLDSARVEDNSVQLRGVHEGGEVCIAAEVQVLQADSAGHYHLQSGPFHRRFLDGYFPVSLHYRVRWPAELLMLESVSPAEQAGFTVTGEPGELQISALFEGRLVIGLAFKALQAQSRAAPHYPAIRNTPATIRAPAARLRDSPVS